MKMGKIIAVMLSSIMIISIGIVVFGKELLKKEEPKPVGTVLASLVFNESNKSNEVLVNFSNQSEERMKIVYDGMTIDELSAKLDRILNDDLKGKGYLYATHSLEMQVDPYLAVAISLLETGCKWTCSRLVKECNNVGGQKGKPACDGGSYKAYDTLDDGIRGFIDNIYYNYVAYGLLTPEQMSRKYAESTTWGGKVSNYIEQIRRI